MPAELDLRAAEARAEPLRAAALALCAAGFDERSVCAFYGVPLCSDAHHMAPPPHRTRRGLGAAIALLLAGEPVERRALALFNDAAIEALVACGLLARDPTAAEALTARISLTPFRGALVAADRLDDRSPDSVRPPDLSAWNVAASLPSSPTSLLDVGCGAGAILLAAALRHARVHGTEVDPRALAFARLNLLLNGLDPTRVTLAEADLREGLAAPSDISKFEVAVFNAPLVRAPFAGDSPLYLHAPGADSLPLHFLAAARAITSDTGCALCHSQLTPEVWAAARSAKFPATVVLEFATAPDGTPHSLISLRAQPANAYTYRFRTPLGPALPHLHREPLDRLHATCALLADAATLQQDSLLAAANPRPAPWLQLTRQSTFDGHAFRPRSLHFGGAPITEEELTALTHPDASIRHWMERGWLVV